MSWVIALSTMLKTLVITALLFSVISITGYARQIVIPEDHRHISNHQATTTTNNQCEPTITNQATGKSIARNDGIDSSEIRLLNWNVLKGSRKQWQSDFQRLVSSADIVALQEAQLHSEFETELESSKFHWDMTTAFRYGGAETGVLVGSNVKPYSSCTLHASEPLIKIPKTALVTKYRIQGSEKVLLLANIHMINFSIGTHEYQQQVSRLIKVIKQHDGPMIVTGDFNTWSEKRIEIISSMISELALSEVIYETDNRLTVFGNPVDHVYFRGLETLRANTESLESSDHNPMIVSFRVI